MKEAPHFVNAVHPLDKTHGFVNTKRLTQNMGSNCSMSSNHGAILKTLCYTGRLAETTQAGLSLLAVVHSL